MEEQATATDNAPHAEWCKLLAPWLNVVPLIKLKINLPPLLTVSDLEKLRIEVSPPPKASSTEETSTLFREVLELLELLARVDPLAAWYLLLECSDQEGCVSHYKDLLTEPSALPKFVIKISEQPRENGSVCTELMGFTKKTNPSKSSKYSEVKTRLLSEWRQQHGGEEFDRNKHGRVSLSIDIEVLVQFDNEADTSVAFTHIVDLARALYQPTGGETDLSDFQIETFGLNLGYARPAVTDLVFQLVNQAASYDLPISWFRITQVFCDKLAPVEFGSFLMKQLVPMHPRLDALGIQRLELDLDTFDAAAVREFCTAISCSKSLRELDLMQDWGDVPQFNRVSSNTWWPWLVYALFSRESCHEIHSVTLSMDLLDFIRPRRDARDVLRHPNPLKYLHELPELVVVTVDTDSEDEDSEDEAEEIHDGEDQVVEHDEDDHSSDDDDEDTVEHPPAPNAVLQKTALLWAGHYSDWRLEQPDPSQDVPVEDSSIPFRVTRDEPEEDFIELVFPGKGICWTKRSHVVEFVPVTRRESHPIRHLTFKDAYDDHAERIVELLEVIGGPIERITVERCSGWQMSALLSAMEVFCPNLKRLDLKECNVETMNWFLEGDGHMFKLETLCLFDTDVDHYETWASFFAALGDTTTHFTKPLRELSVGFSGSHGTVDPITDDHVFGHVVTLLETNHHLARCDLHSHKPEMLAKYGERVLSHHGEYISGEETPLPHEETLAFLSVITPLASKGSPIRKQAIVTAAVSTCARFKMSPDLAKLVLEFAATPKTRVCGMFFHPTAV